MDHPAARAAIREAELRPVIGRRNFSCSRAHVAVLVCAVLPLVWFNLGAIVYDHDLSGVGGQTRRVAGHAIDRWKALPKPVTDFMGHFWMGSVKRWNAVMNGVFWPPRPDLR